MIGAVPAWWRAPLGVLALLWIFIIALFAGDFAAMIGLWWSSSTFNHILLMVPLIGWLVVQRAALLAPLQPRSWWPGIGLILLAGAVWLVGDAASVALFRQLGLILMLQAAVATALGPRLVRALAFPMAYALLLVPMGEGLVPLFQRITADLSMALLAFSGIAATRDGILIATPRGLFEVAEACSGVMFLIAMAAFAILAAHLCFKSWLRRLVFVAGALAATVLANALRAFGTIWIAEHHGVRYAAGFDHIVYGWVFFGLVIAAVMLIARRWFDRPANDAAVDVRGLDRAPRLMGSPFAVGAAAVLALLVAPVWAGVASARSGALPAIVKLPEVAGWTIGGTPDPHWKARFDGADHFIQRRYTDARGRSVDVALVAFASQGEGRELVGFGQGAVDPASGWIRTASGPALSGAPVDRLFHPGPVWRDAAIWYRVDDRLLTAPTSVKLYGLRARLLGGDPRAAALVVSAEVQRGGADAMRDWLAAAGGAREVADRALKSR